MTNAYDCLPSWRKTHGFAKSNCGCSVFRALNHVRPLVILQFPNCNKLCVCKERYIWTVIVVMAEDAFQGRKQLDSSRTQILAVYFTNWSPSTEPSSLALGHVSQLITAEYGPLVDAVKECHGNILSRVFLSRIECPIVLFHSRASWVEVAIRTVHQLINDQVVVAQTTKPPKR